MHSGASALVSLCIDSADFNCLKLRYVNHICKKVIDFKQIEMQDWFKEQFRQRAAFF
jgi:hypothetical protein